MPHLSHATQARYLWQTKTPFAVIYQDYLITPHQKRLDGFTNYVGNLRRFASPIYDYPTSDLLQAHLVEESSRSKLTFEITPFDFYGNGAKEQGDGEGAPRVSHFRVEVETPGDPIIFPAVKGDTLLRNVRTEIEQLVGRHYMRGLYCGKILLERELYPTPVQLKLPEHQLRSLPHTDHTIHLRIDSGFWCQPATAPDAFREAPEKLVFDKDWQKFWLPRKTIVFNAYLLSPYAASHVVSTPDVTASSSPLEEFVSPN